MDDQRFDRHARSLALGLSRRQVARGLVGGLAALGWGRALAQDELDFDADEGPDPEATDPTCRGRPAIDNNRCPRPQCTRNANCFCAETVRGNKRCVNLRGVRCPRRDQCDKNRQCGSGEVCVKVGGCCRGRKRNLCIRLCG